MIIVIVSFVVTFLITLVVTRNKFDKYRRKGYDEGCIDRFRFVALFGNRKYHDGWREGWKARGEYESERRRTDV